ncbi:MAG: AraC family transcriptional regulator, partial [Candidatus Competibacterales bacterium]
PAGTRDATHLICGVFVLRDTALTPLFQALPAVLQLDVTDPTASPWLDALTQNLRRETAMPHPGGRFVVERLLELLCAEALRHHLHTDASAATNWFAGIRDPALAKALAAFHADPAHPWNLEGLAAAANLSRSRLYARFRAYLGDSPMGYVTKWRMNLACRLLGQTELAVEQIAARTGYDSPAAFTRAFQRTVGASPSRWRSQLPGGDPGGVTRRGKSLELALD